MMSCIAGRDHAGENARHDQQADAVADSIFVDLLSQPHEEDRAGGHGQHAGKLPDEGQRTVDEQFFVDQAGRHEPADVEPALADAQDDGGVAGVFVDLLPAALAFLLQFFQRRIDAAEQLEDNRGRDVGHDAQAEDRRLAQLAGAEHGHLVEQIAQTLLARLAEEDGHLRLYRRWAG